MKDTFVQSELVKALDDTLFEMTAMCNISEVFQVAKSAIVTHMTQFQHYFMRIHLQKRITLLSTILRNIPFHFEINECQFSETATPNAIVVAFHSRLMLFHHSFQHFHSDNCAGHSISTR
jgi:hypothetical protein